LGQVVDSRTEGGPPGPGGGDEPAQGIWVFLTQIWTLPPQGNMGHPGPLGPSRGAGGGVGKGAPARGPIVVFQGNFSGGKTKGGGGGGALAPPPKRWQNQFLWGQKQKLFITLWGGGLGSLFFALFGGQDFWVGPHQVSTGGPKRGKGIGGGKRGGGGGPPHEAAARGPPPPILPQRMQNGGLLWGHGKKKKKKKVLFLFWGTTPVGPLPPGGGGGGGGNQKKPFPFSCWQTEGWGR